MWLRRRASPSDKARGIATPATYKAFPNRRDCTRSIGDRPVERRQAGACSKGMRSLSGARWACAQASRGKKAAWLRCPILGSLPFGPEHVFAPLTPRRICAASEEPMDWPQALKDYRRRHGLTQAALAEILNVDPTTVSRWERGRDQPALSIHRRLRSLVVPLTSDVERALRALIDASDAIAVLFDDKYRLLHSSPKHRLLLRLDAAELYGRPFQSPVGIAGRFAGDRWRPARLVAQRRYQDGRHPASQTLRASSQPESISPTGRGVDYSRRS